MDGSRDKWSEAPDEGRPLLLGHVLLEHQRGVVATEACEQIMNKDRTLRSVLARMVGYHMGAQSDRDRLCCSDHHIISFDGCVPRLSETATLMSYLMALLGT